MKLFKKKNEFKTKLTIGPLSIKSTEPSNVIIDGGLNGECVTIDIFTEKGNYHITYKEVENNGSSRMV